MDDFTEASAMKHDHNHFNPGDPMFAGGLSCTYGWIMQRTLCLKPPSEALVTLQGDRVFDLTSHAACFQ